MIDALADWWKEYWAPVCGIGALVLLLVLFCFVCEAGHQAEEAEKATTKQEAYDTGYALGRAEGYVEAMKMQPYVEVK